MCEYECVLQCVVLFSSDVCVYSCVCVDFKEALPQVCEAVEEADFIAIDGEFTGPLLTHKHAFECV